jgi:hypothetical protein
MEAKHRYRLTALIGFTLAVMGFAAHADQKCTISTSGALSCTPAGPTIGCVVTPQGTVLCGDKPTMIHLTDSGSAFQSQSSLNVTKLAKQLGFAVLPESGGFHAERSLAFEGPTRASHGWSASGVELATYADVHRQTGATSG